MTQRQLWGDEPEERPMPPLPPPLPPPSRGPAPSFLSSGGTELDMAAFEALRKAWLDAKGKMNLTRPATYTRFLRAVQHGLTSRHHVDGCLEWAKRAARCKCPSEMPGGSEELLARGLHWLSLQENPKFIPCLGVWLNYDGPKGHRWSREALDALDAQRRAGDQAEADERRRRTGRPAEFTGLRVQDQDDHEGLHGPRRYA